MPLVDHSTYRKPRFLISGHLETILPAVFRRFSGRVRPDRERLSTHDGDTLVLDRYRQGSPRAVILSHGLEGSSRARYIRGMAAALMTAGMPVSPRLAAPSGRRSGRWSFWRRIAATSG
jgi:uncharacterized protein